MVLISRQMGSGGLTLIASPEYDICHYVRNWLSEASTTDGERKVLAENITNKTPLSEVLRTEHAYMSLYGELEVVFKISEESINQILRKNPTVQVSVIWFWRLVGISGGRRAESRGRPQITNHKF